MDLAGRSVLVTGARGFIGSHLRRALEREGAEVHATSRAEADPPAAWWRPDLEDIASVRELLARVRPRVVYHLAGHVSAAPDRALVLPTLRSLFVSAVNLMLAASERGDCRVVLAGSLTESSGPGDPAASPYAAAKTAASTYAELFHALYDLPVVSARLFMTYGPGQHPSKVLPYTAASLLRGESPELSSGNQTADWIYVDDVAEALVRIGRLEGLDGSRIDLGSGELTSLREVVALLAAEVGGPGAPRFGARPDRPREREQTRRADVEEAAARLGGWRARVSLPEGLRRTVAWLRDPGALPGGT